MNASEIAALFDAKRTASGWEAKCPAHEDGRASLSIAEAPDGKVLLHCHAGCTTADVLAARGLTLKDLFAPRQDNRKARIVKAYDYTNEVGTLLFQVVRFTPKDFRQRRPDPDAKDVWSWNVTGVPRVLYRLPGVLRNLQAITGAGTVFVVEGEKDADAMVKQGFVATCNAGGAGKWLPEYSETLRGANVVVIADKDTPGRRHAQAVAASLHGKAASIRVIECPDVNGKTVKDPSDYFAAGGNPADLDELAEGAPMWTPSTEPAPEAPRIETAPTDETDETAFIRGQIIRWLMADETAAKQRAEICKAVLASLQKVGHLYYHAERRDFDSAMFFHRARGRLERIRSSGDLAFSTGPLLC